MLKQTYYKPKFLQATGIQESAGATCCVSRSLRWKSNADAFGRLFEPLQNAEWKLDGLIS